MERKKRGSCIYLGIGKDGKFRNVKFDYHKDREILKPGTASQIRKSLLFESDKQMREYINSIL